MKKKQYTCPSGCNLPKRRRTIIYNNSHYYVGYNDFNYCPICGTLMPNSYEILKSFCDYYGFHSKLEESVKLMLKSEFEAAARSAFVLLEETLRSKSGLDLSGYDLVAKSMKYDIDSHTGEVIKRPLIAINKLKTVSERNEQDGLRLMMMGYFKGQRNIYQHNNIQPGASDSIATIIETDYFLKRIDGDSVLDEGTWIPTKISYKDILSKMPRKKDRLWIKLNFFTNTRKNK